RLQRRQIVWLQPRNRRHALPDPIEAHHARLQLAQPNRHRIEMTLDSLVAPLRLFALIGEDDRREPWVLNDWHPLERDIIEREREYNENREKRGAAAEPMGPLQRNRPRPGAGAAHQYDVQLACAPKNIDTPATSRSCRSPLPFPRLRMSSNAIRKSRPGPLDCSRKQR